MVVQGDGRVVETRERPPVNQSPEAALVSRVLAHLREGPRRHVDGVKGLRPVIRIRSRHLVPDRPQANAVIQKIRECGADGAVRFTDAATTLRNLANKYEETDAEVF